MPFSPPLAATRSRLGPAPRSLAGLPPAILHPDPPRWLKPSDGLWPGYHHFEQFLAEGSLTWGCIVQANQILWKDGHEPSAALIVHGVDPANDPSPSVLENTAVRVGSLRGQKPRDPEWAAVAHIVEDELARKLRQPIPPSLAAGPPVALSTLLIWPDHLPVPRLACSLLPVLLHPQHACLVVLPQPLWHDDLRQLWLEWEPS